MASCGIKCLLCHGSRCKQDMFLSSIQGLPGHVESRVAVCPDCGLRFLHPYFTEDEIGAMYKKEYYSSDYSDLYSSEEHTLDRAKKFAASLNLMLKHCENPKSILDVGAANGLFLSLAQKQGLEVTGIELSEAASRKAREKYGFTFHSVKMEDFNVNRQFDIVHLNHVLEHLSDPHKAVEAIRKFLRPGGIAYIEVPLQLNVYDRLKYRILKRGWKFDDINSVHHPVFYSPKTLRRLFSEHNMHCRHMSLFGWERFPRRTTKEWGSCLMWACLCRFEQGKYIEAIFEKGC